jgi:hypothetical protein
MADIPKYQQWLTDTSLGVLRPRSGPLKAVDETIREYERAANQPNLFKVKNAFEDWKRFKGASWKTSDRNRAPAFAITRLDDQLKLVADGGLYRLTHGWSIEELRALRYMAEERKKVIARIFEGKEVTFRNSPRGVKEAVKDAGEKVKQSCGQAQSWLHGTNKKGGLSTEEKIKQKLEEMVKEFFSVDSLEKIVGLYGLILEILAQCSVSMAPVVGHIQDGAELFTGWAKAGAALHKQHSISHCAYHIDTGAPTAAFQGLRDCLIEETKKETASASIATTSFALKTGLAFADGGLISGPVVGAADAMASLSLQLYYLAAEYKATKAINEALSQGHLDVRLFETYPLMGCYMLTSATFSDLIPIECFGTPGWMDYVETLKKRSFDGIYEASNNLIDGSPWEIKGLPKRPVKGGGLQFGMISQAKDIGSKIKEIFS